MPQASLRDDVVAKLNAAQQQQNNRLTEVLLSLEAGFVDRTAGLDHKLDQILLGVVQGAGGGHLQDVTEENVGRHMGAVQDYLDQKFAFFELHLREMTSTAITSSGVCGTSSQAALPDVNFGFTFWSSTGG